MVRRIGPVEAQASTVAVSGNVYRNPFVSSGDTGGLSLVAATPNLVSVLNGSMTQGRFLDDALGAYPNTVLARSPRSGSGSPRSTAPSGSGSAASGSP